jgi:hypothetical protein
MTVQFLVALMCLIKQQMHLNPLFSLEMETLDWPVDETITENFKICSTTRKLEIGA